MGVDVSILGGVDSEKEDGRYVWLNPCSRSWKFVTRYGEKTKPHNPRPQCRSNTDREQIQLHDESTS